MSLVISRVRRTTPQTKLRNDYTIASTLLAEQKRKNTLLLRKVEDQQREILALRFFIQSLGYHPPVVQSQSQIYHYHDDSSTG